MSFPIYVMCNLHIKETEISQKRSKGIKLWNITYSVILNVLSNKTNLILGFNSPLTKFCSGKTFCDKATLQDFNIMHNNIGLKCWRKPRNFFSGFIFLKFSSKISNILGITFVLLFTFWRSLPWQRVQRISVFFLNKFPSFYKIFFFFCNFSSFLRWNFFKLRILVGIASRNILNAN